MLLSVLLLPNFAVGAGTTCEGAGTAREIDKCLAEFVKQATLESQRNEAAAARAYDKEQRERSASDKSENERYEEQDLEVELDMRAKLDAARKANAHDATTLSELKKSQDAWERYRMISCGAIFLKNLDKPDRVAQLVGCRMELAHERAHHLRSWYLDAGKPNTPVGTIRKK